MFKVGDKVKVRKNHEDYCAVESGTYMVTQVLPDGMCSLSTFYDNGHVGSQCEICLYHPTSLIAVAPRLRFKRNIPDWM